ncbi:MAG: hypothetical protein K2N63_08410 [Lachnospiraceae bacterium]|nr:hypothetical protein [Lachnospiraceae bacterium]
MMYPKNSRKKKRKISHPPSILHQDNGTCYLCLKLDHNLRIYKDLETHHIFGGPNRKISEANGFKVALCIRHHRTGPDAVHNKIGNLRMLQKDAQREYEKTHTREQFMELIGRNYLEDGENGEKAD